jgi:hypothetical protein
MALLSEADLYEDSHLLCQMATQAFCRALQADADVVISQPGLRRGAGRCSNARWGRPCIWPRSSNAPLLRSRRPRPDPGIARSVERAGAVVPTTKQHLLHHGFPSRRSTAGKVAFCTASTSVTSCKSTRGAAVPDRVRGSLICPGRPVSPHARGFLRMTAGSGPWLFL